MATKRFVVRATSLTLGAFAVAATLSLGMSGNDLAIPTVGHIHVGSTGDVLAGTNGTLNVGNPG